MWYVLQVSPNSEKLFVKNANASLRDYGIEFFSPPVDDMNGKKLKRYTGYILVKCDGELTQEIIDKVSNMEKFIRFLPIANNPVPISDNEANNLLMEEIVHTRKTFEIGRRARIIEGTFKNIEGTISDVNNDKKSVTLDIVFAESFSTTLTLEFDHVEQV